MVIHGLLRRISWLWCVSLPGLFVGWTMYACVCLHTDVCRHTQRTMYVCIHPTYMCMGSPIGIAQKQDGSFNHCISIYTAF